MPIRYYDDDRAAEMLESLSSQRGGNNRHEVGGERGGKFSRDPEVPIARVADLAYKVHKRVLGIAPTPFEELPVEHQAAWEAAVRVMLSLWSHDGEALGKPDLEDHAKPFVQGYLPPRLRGSDYVERDEPIEVIRP